MTAYYAIPPAAALAGVAVAALLWLLRCNDRTLKERLFVLDFIEVMNRARHPETRATLDAFHRVSYNSHFLARMTFRDPAKLYGPNVARILRPENGDE
ncbi:hypothetical protein [Ruegeria jejuensis]|uniref:hypothetical protein n=1 Tax=Ruegeria jejuensis TaxID=3233338 RepID=UPI00355B1104